MNHLEIWTVSFCVALTATHARANTQAAAQQVQAATAQTTGIRLEDSTPVRLRLQRTLSSADAQVDERVDFDVLEEVRVGETVLIPKESVAWGTVTAA